MQTIGGFEARRSTRCECLAMACGRFDAYREQAIMPWDVAAGWTLVEAAGGVVRARFTDLSSPMDVVASNVALSKAIGES